MTPCTHEIYVYLYKTFGAYVMWCTMCGASTTFADATVVGHKWRLPEREKWNLGLDDTALTPEEPSKPKPITLELNPSELQTLAKWAHVYLSTDRKPVVCPETEVALQVIEAHARFLTAVLKGKP